MTLHDQLIVTVTDKLLIAGILLVAGFLVNKAFERYKNREAALTEFAKQRVTRIADVWTALYNSENAVDEYLRTAATIVKESGQLNDPVVIERLTQVANLSKEKSSLAEATAKENRFWLGERVYLDMMNYHNQYMAKIEAFMEQDFERFRAAESAAEFSKVDLMKVLKREFSA